MLYQEWNRYKVLQVFFDYPNKKWQLREIERTIGLSHPSVKDHIEKLRAEGFVECVEEGVFKGYRANKNSMFRQHKLNDLIMRLRDSGLIDKIEENCTPNCIVLFGSSVQGRDDERGDVDVFIQSKKKSIELDKFEKYIQRKISLLFEPDLQSINAELLNSLANGIVLSGYMKLIE